MEIKLGTPIRPQQVLVYKPGIFINWSIISQILVRGGPPSNTNPKEGLLRRTA